MCVYWIKLSFFNLLIRLWTLIFFKCQSLLVVFLPVTSWPLRLPKLESDVLVKCNFRRKHYILCSSEPFLSLRVLDFRPKNKSSEGDKSPSVLGSVLVGKQQHKQRRWKRRMNTNNATAPTDHAEGNMWLGCGRGLREGKTDVLHVGPSPGRRTTNQHNSRQTVTHITRSPWRPESGWLLGFTVKWNIQLNKHESPQTGGHCEDTVRTLWGRCTVKNTRQNPLNNCEVTIGTE